VLADNIREVQKATANFTALIGQGAFGPVYKAQMSTGEIVAVKVLANDSKQAEKEFQNEVPISCILFLHIDPAYFLISN
jgi:serine/threonine protein kinase